MTIYLLKLLEHGHRMRHNSKLDLHLKRGINLGGWLIMYIEYRVPATAQGFTKGGWWKVCDLKLKLTHFLWIA